MTQRVRRRVRVTGVVQGVGFRPFVHALAQRFDLSGHVRNDASGVVIEIEGALWAVDSFLGVLCPEAPPLSKIDRVEAEPVAIEDDGAFRIIPSDDRGKRHVLVTADSATCDDCLRELFDPTDRRFCYAFLNCTHCGPRYTIIRDLPYDRPMTTMAEFEMCDSCRKEYNDPADRRFHAQPVCCPDCGPRLTLLDSQGREHDDQPLDIAVSALERGEILAVKGLGGFHLAVDATNASVVAELRERKRRYAKPFALMVPDLESGKILCVVDQVTEHVLTSRQRPIVVIPRRRSTSIAAEVAPDSGDLGIMLPYTPLHHLLMHRFARPIVLTSDNESGGPISHRDEDVRRSGIADLLLTHDRKIHVRTDDSVIRVFRDRPLPLRRSRGYAPEPVEVPWQSPQPVLACGAELKNTFSLLRGHHLFLSPHIGDLENYETYASYVESITHYQKLFGITPSVVAHDLHPEYLSTKYALDRDGVELVGVQHHHAHIAACLADNREAGPVLGVAFDGLGYGPDETLWGGEFLIADLAGFRRLAHLTDVALPGGKTAVRQPWRMAVSYLVSCSEIDESAAVLRRNPSWPNVIALCRLPGNNLRTSSAGRLFDAVAAILGVRDEAEYEGQAAVELEQIADRYETGAYPVPTGKELKGTELVRSVLEELRSGVPVPVIAARFHNGVSRLITETCRWLRDSTGLSTVALSGGVFQNMLLLSRTVHGLEAHGFRCLVHHHVPSNDGGISAGQAVVAGARMRQMGDV